MTLADRILDELGRHQSGLADDELAVRLGVIRQAVNQSARRLAVQGRLVRDASGPKITNRIRGTAPLSPPAPPRAASPSGLLAEDEVKAAVRDHLVAEGYEVSVAWGRTRGVDIDARGPAGRLLLEAKGEVALQPQQVNYFVGALGELVQRMADGDARYGLALPDNRQYRGLVSRLPDVAWQRLGLIVFFVGRSPAGCVVTREERG
jgi:hypothetical protein